jgi:2-keto-4-pentenoate hydratase/2-oxohepta-3-ene-1,7-dioic acid hydratase in catechol pathway
MLSAERVAARESPKLELITYNAEPVERAAIRCGGRTYLPSALRDCAGVLDVVRRWDSLAPTLRAWTPSPDEVVEGGRPVMPLAFPAKVLCSGPNYTDHLAEMGESGLGDNWTAYFFLKPPTTTLIGDRQPIVVDDVATARVDWEGELGVVIGRRGRSLDPRQAVDHIAGYVVANDISLRAPHRRETPARPFQWDWLASKGADNSLPISDGMVPAWLVPDPQALRIITTVNGEVMQDGHTSDMVLDVGRLIADASRLTTLEPGDLILTGTPAGVGASRGAFLKDGDTVEVSIPGVGSVRNRVQQS